MRLLKKCRKIVAAKMNEFASFSSPPQQPPSSLPTRSTQQSSDSTRSNASLTNGGGRVTFVEDSASHHPQMPASQSSSSLNQSEGQSSMDSSSHSIVRRKHSASLKLHLPASSIDPNLDSRHPAAAGLSRDAVPCTPIPGVPSIANHLSNSNVVNANRPASALPSTASSPNFGAMFAQAVAPPTTPLSGIAESPQPQKEIPDVVKDESDPITNENFQKLVNKKEVRDSIANRSPRDFFFIRVLGEGSFSTVYFAKEVDTGNDYAIKVLMKNEIKRQRRVQYVIREKDVMAALTYGYGGHPFVVRLYCTFQDHDRLYFAMAYAKHGELLDWLHRLGSFDDAVTLFYASEILSALEFLHVKCKIIHRDLKPENILVNSDWHIMLSDFGTAKIICDPNKAKKAKEDEKEKEDSNVKSIQGQAEQKNSAARSSFVGTAQYISPEVLKGEPVGPECDYWALGAIVFQMISGQPPFRALNEYQILKKILGLDFHFPHGFPTMARDLVERLLVYKPAERLGSKETGGIEALKGHGFFKDVDWSDLPGKKPPELKPYLPASCGEPAFYSDYPIPENLEPGLNEAALNRLMGLGLGTSSNFQEFEYHKEDDEEGSSTTASIASGSVEPLPPPLTPEMIEKQMAALKERRRQERLEAQRQQHKYHRFVEEQLILKYGLIDKKKGLFARRRMFLLCDGSPPRLFYVDPINMDLKGEVPFSQDMRTEAKNFRTFFVHTPNRTYYLFDPERHAKDWCDAIDFVRDQFYNGGSSSGNSVESTTTNPFLLPTPISSLKADSKKPQATSNNSAKSMPKGGKSKSQQQKSGGEKAASQKSKLFGSRNSKSNKN